MTVLQDKCQSFLEILTYHSLTHAVRFAKRQNLDANLHELFRYLASTVVRADTVVSRFATFPVEMKRATALFVENLLSERVARFAVDYVVVKKFVESELSFDAEDPWIQILVQNIEGKMKEGKGFCWGVGEDEQESSKVDLEMQDFAQRETVVEQEAIMDFDVAEEVLSEEDRVFIAYFQRRMFKDGVVSEEIMELEEISNQWLYELPGEKLSLVIQELVSADIQGITWFCKTLCCTSSNNSKFSLSFDQICRVFRGFLFPQVSLLKRPAPRNLHSLILSLAKDHSKAMVYSVISPTINEQSSSKYSNPQSELICRAIKEALDDSSKEILIVEISKVEELSRWADEHFLKTLDTLVSNGGYSFSNSVAEYDPIVKSFVAKLDQVSSQSKEVCRSVKFSAVVCHFLSQHGQRLSPYIDVMRKTVQRLETFMQKVASASLSQIER